MVYKSVLHQAEDELIASVTERQLDHDCCPAIVTRASFEYAHLHREPHPRRHLPLFSTGAYLQTFVQVECVFEGNPATAGSGFTGSSLSNCNGFCRQNTTGQLAVVVIGEYLDLRPVEVKRGCFFECADPLGC